MFHFNFDEEKLFKISLESRFFRKNERLIEFGSEESKNLSIKNTLTGIIFFESIYQINININMILSSFFRINNFSIKDRVFDLEIEQEGKIKIEAVDIYFWNFPKANIFEKTLGNNQFNFPTKNS